jgi:hypothetical protein
VSTLRGSRKRDLALEADATIRSSANAIDHQRGLTHLRNTLDRHRLRQEAQTTERCVNGRTVQPETRLRRFRRRSLDHFQQDAVYAGINLYTCLRSHSTGIDDLVDLSAPHVDTITAW